MIVIAINLRLRDSDQRRYRLNKKITKNVFFLVSTNLPVPRLCSAMPRGHVHINHIRIFFVVTLLRNRMQSITWPIRCDNNNLILIVQNKTRIIEQHRKTVIFIRQV